MSPNRERLHRWGEMAWDVLRIMALAAVVIWLLYQVKLVVIPLMLGTIAASLGTPLAGRLVERGLPRLVATWIVLLLFAGLVGLVSWFVVSEIRDAADEMATALEEAWSQVQAWLAAAPFGLGERSITDFFERFFEAPEEGPSLGSRLLSGFSTATEAIAGVFLTLIVAFFVVKDGDRLWTWFESKLSPQDRPRMERAGLTAWATVRRYFFGTAVVGVLNATAVAIALMILGTPLVLPLAILMFLGAFFPLVGAIVSGSVVVLTVLATNGLVDALIMAAVVIGVQQLEGDLVMPVVLGKVIALHPLLILFGITAGFVIGGVVGAFVAVPFIAMGAEVIRTMWPDLLKTDRGSRLEPG